MIDNNINIKTNAGIMDSYICYPNTSKSLPSIIFYMDAPAIRQELRDMCKKIAEEGYIVLLPNLFYRHGKEGKYPFDQNNYKDKDELKKMITTMNSTTNKMITEDTEFIINYINKIKNAQKNKIGIVGYCMSGRFVVTCGAKYNDQIQAVASFYGVGIYTEEEDSPHLYASKIKGETYLAFAEKDIWVTNEQIKRINETFSKVNDKVTIEIYKNTEHGFAFPDRFSYNERAASKHWKELLELFHRNLK